jgi:hypothetical protein
LGWLLWQWAVMVGADQGWLGAYLTALEPWSFPGRQKVGAVGLHERHSVAPSLSKSHRIDYPRVDIHQKRPKIIMACFQSVQNAIS